MLVLDNFSISVKEHNLINKIYLTVPDNEMHFLMGPNGSGKSTIGQAIIGNQDFQVTSGNIFFNHEVINHLSVTERANLGIFLSFQEPIEIPGLSSIQLLKEILNNKQLTNHQDELSPVLLLQKIYSYADDIGVSKEFLLRDLNVNCSGGEKKLNEMLYMMVLQPRLCILDEIDSGVDLDLLSKIVHHIQVLHSAGTSFLIITHNINMISLLQPDRVHIITQGCIRHQYDAKDALMILRRSGYKHFV